MEVIKIWYAAGSGGFPLDLSSSSRFKLEIEQLSLDELSQVKPNLNQSNVFIIRLQEGETSKGIELIKSAFELMQFARILVVPEKDYQVISERLSGIIRLWIIDDTIRSSQLQVMIESILQSEYYRNVVQSISTELRAQSSVLDGFLTLTRKELENSKAETEAYQNLLNFESSYRKFEEKIESAMERALDLKDEEMLQLKSQVRALERLSDFRDKELKATKATLDAQQAALDLSRKENMEREKIIDALQKLNIYTDTEVMELFQENNQLRNKLGMPPREG